MQRFTAKRPASTLGATFSMTTRRRPSSGSATTGWRALAMAFGAQEYDRQRRQPHRQCVIAAVRAHRRRFDGAEVAHAAAAVDRSVAVQDLLPQAAVRCADQVVLTRHGREVANDEDRGASAPRPAQKRNDARFGIAV